MLYFLRFNPGGLDESSPYRIDYFLTKILRVKNRYLIMKILFTCKEFPHAKVIGGSIIIYNRDGKKSLNTKLALGL